MIRNLGRFRPEHLLAPRSIAVLGAATACGQTVVRNLRAGGTKAELLLLDRPADIAGLPEPPDLGVIASAETQPALEALSQRDVGVAIALGSGPVSPDGCRVIGPRAFGVIVTGAGLNASLAHLPPRPGKLALISPSAALCRTVLDWAEPNGVGFSHIIGTGAETDIDAAVILDVLSREPATGAILLDIRAIRERRAFLSAARAAARLRPVVAIHAGARQHDPTGRADRVFDAALRRAGVLRVSTMAELLAAAETLTRARPPRSETLMIVTNAIGPGQLAADQAVRSDVPLARPDLAAQTILHGNLPPQAHDPGLVWTGDDQPTRVAEAVAMISAIPEVGGVAAVLAPTGEMDGAGVAALAAAQPGLRLPLLACVLGETTGAAHRRTLAEAGIPIFASPEQAVRGFAQLLQLRRARAAARELPPRRVLSMTPDLAAVHALIAAARAEDRTSLYQDETLRVLAAYGVPTLEAHHARTAAEAADAAARLGFPVAVKRRRLEAEGEAAMSLDLPDAAAVQRVAERLAAAGYVLVQRQAGRAQRLRLTVADDRLFGPAIGFGPGGRDRLADTEYELPPLNLALATALVGRSRAAKLLAAGQGHGEADTQAVADTLVRISQLVVDVPEMSTLVIDPLFAHEGGVFAAEAWMGLRPLGERADPAIAPYPEELVEQWQNGGETIEIRPIRPEDAEAEAALFERLPPEDIRYRFFTMLRHLPPEQIARLTQIDYDREMAFVAVRGGELLGVSRLVREPPGSEGEFAIVVDPSLKGRGLGRKLMQRVLDWARSEGLTAVVGQVLADNQPMLAFMRRLGFELHRIPNEPDLVEARCPL